LRVDLNADPGGAKLRCHRIEIAYAKIDHPHFAGVPEICRGFRERRKGRWPGLLLPGRRFVTRGNDGHAQMIAVPLRKRDRVTGEEKQSGRCPLLFPFLPRSEAQFGEVVVAVGEAGKSILRPIVFDDEVLNAGLVRVGEDAFPVDDARADIGHVSFQSFQLR